MIFFRVSATIYYQTIILFPIFVKSVNSQRGLQKLQPKMQELQKLYKDDREKQAKEMLELYKKEKINPFSGILLAIIQVPILIALYRVFWRGLDPNELSILYSFITSPGHINPYFFHILDLSKPNMILAILSGVVQYYQTKMIMPKQKQNPDAKNPAMDFNQVMQKQMIYVLPVFTIIILISLPSALGLYWAISGILSIIQQYMIIKKEKPETN